MRPSKLVKTFSVKAISQSVRFLFRTSIDYKGNVGNISQISHPLSLLLCIPTLPVSESLLHLFLLFLASTVYSITYHCEQILILSDNSNFFPTKFSYDSQETLCCQHFIYQQLKIVPTEREESTQLNQWQELGRCALVQCKTEQF